MSISERKRLEQIDRKIGRLHGQFQDITREMRRLYEAEMNAEDFAQKILTWIAATRKRAQSDERHSGTCAVNRFDVLVDDIEQLCKEQLGKAQQAMAATGGQDNVSTTTQV